MNIGKAAGFAILLALAGLFVLRPPKPANTNQRASDSPGSHTSQAPSYAVHLVNLACGGIGIDGAQITVENRGPEIPFARAFVDFIAADGTIVGAADAYFSPTTIPERSRASAKLYSRGTRAESCRLSRVQDGKGHPVDLN